MIPSIDRFDLEPFADRFEIIRPRIARSDRDFPTISFGNQLEEVFARLQPDLIVHDCCPARWLATTSFPDCPRANVTNIFLTKVAAAETVQVASFKRKARRINAERRRKGLRELGSAHECYDADQVLLADPHCIVSLFPSIPSNYHACGACWWEYEGAMPPILQEASDVLLYSMGSTGGVVNDRFSKLLADRFGCRDIVRVHAGKDRERVRRLAGHRVFELGMSPLEPLLAKARAVVTQGGTGSTYQALAAEQPVVVVPGHANHAVLGKLLERLGVGITITSRRQLSRLSPQTFADVRAQAKSLGGENFANEGDGEIAARLAQLVAR